MPYVDHQAQRYARDHEYGDGGADNRHERQLVFGLQQHDRGEHADRGHDQAAADPHVPAGRRAGRETGGEVGGERGQFGMRPRGGCLSHPRVVFILGQPALRQRRLQSADPLFAVGVGRAEIAAAPALRSCCLTIRPFNRG
jgi:hypothetical protein